MTRGHYLQGAYSRAVRARQSMSSLAETLMNSARRGVRLPYKGLTFGQFLNTGLTPQFRFIFGDNGAAILGMISAILGTEEDRFTS